MARRNHRSLQVLDAKSASRWAGEVVPCRYPSGPFYFLAPVPSPSNPLSTRDRPVNVDPQILSTMERGKTSAWSILAAAHHQEMLRLDYAHIVNGKAAA